jgi:hypothetical protein
MRAAVSRLLWKPYAIAFNALPVVMAYLCRPILIFGKLLTFLLFQCSKKLKLNKRGEFKTWRFTGTLKPTHHINEDIHWIAANNIAVLEPDILLVKACIRQKIMNQAKPGSVTFISWRFTLQP